MPVKLQPVSVIKARLGIEPNGPVQKFLQNTCYKAMDTFVPYANGDLRNEVDLSDPNYIIYEMPYARYMYYGKKMVMSNGKSAFYSRDYGFWSKKGEPKTLTDIDLVYHAHGTGPKWDERMWTAKGQEVIKQVQEYIKRRK